MPTMHLHSRQLLLIARETVIRCRGDAEQPAALTADSILALVMSAAATEAFINEFAEYAPLVFSSLDPAEIPSVVVACAQVLQDLEESRVPLTTKYLVGSQVLSGRSFDAGGAPYQDFKLLIDLRNAIMHIKVAVEGDRHAGQRVADVLAQKGLAIASTGPGSLPWFDRLQTPAVARWAHDSALGIIRAFLDLVPVRAHFDPLEFYRRFFREHPAAE
jgi:hypothetical protein